MGSTLNWISSFLTGRTQRVICGGCISESSGVPQGSVLGPLLFLLCVNGISQHVYADDCILYRKIESMQRCYFVAKQSVFT